MKRQVLLAIIFVSSLISIETFAQESVTDLLSKAKAKAQKENKAIFVKFEASWCGWCHKMTADMKAPTTKEFFQKNFVMLPIVVQESRAKKSLENPGGNELLKTYRGDQAGLPFWVILDKNGKRITDSYSKGQNLGGPTEPWEVRTFIRKLRKAVPKLTKEDKEAILKQFVKK